MSVIKSSASACVLPWTIAGVPVEVLRGALEPERHGVRCRPCVLAGYQGGERSVQRNVPQPRGQSGPAAAGQGRKRGVEFRPAGQLRSPGLNSGRGSRTDGWSDARYRTIGNRDVGGHAAARLARCGRQCGAHIGEAGPALRRPLTRELGSAQGPTVRLDGCERHDEQRAEGEQSCLEGRFRDFG